MSNKENFTGQKASGEHSQLREEHIRGHRNKRRAGVFRTLQVLQLLMASGYGSQRGEAVNRAGRGGAGELIGDNIKGFAHVSTLEVGMISLISAGSMFPCKGSSVSITLPAFLPFHSLLSASREFGSISLLSRIEQPF